MPSALHEEMQPHVNVLMTTRAIHTLSANQDVWSMVSVLATWLVSAKSAGTPVLAFAALMQSVMSQTTCRFANVILDTQEMRLSLVKELQHVSFSKLEILNFAYLQII